ncbi:hypothetical protein C3L33_22730, partial [Rhododendron williamsianum]
MPNLPSPFPPLPAPFLYFLLTLMPFLVISQPLADQSQTILLTIKERWGNPPQLSSWSTSSPPCSWPEITCTGSAVTGLNLTNYNITEPIPPSICNLKNLTVLDLSYNYFPGNFPTVLYNCSNLRYLDLSQNYFVGPIPSNIDRLSSSLRFNFTKANILAGLTENNLIGSGGSGKIYRVAVNNSGDYVAVKKIWTNGKLDNKLEKEFSAEVDTLGTIRHCNIVKLLCCISSEDSKLLVYEYMENQSLDKWLHVKKRRETDPARRVVLDWPK